MSTHESQDERVDPVASAPRSDDRPSPEDRPLGGSLGADDDFDPLFVARLRATVFRFLHDAYWRVDVHGIERLPTRGGAVLVGVHRGFVPFDAMMALHAVAGSQGRIPRFLIHPGLLRFEPISSFVRKLGGLLANRENGDRVLTRGEILGIFPEGIGGAFVEHRRAHRLQRTGRPEYVRMALRNRVPIVPMVTVGSAETFPVWKQLRWRWWKRRTGWPCFPMTPTFPLLPVPLPSKWHTWIHEPMRVDLDYSPEAADDPLVVRRIAHEVEMRLAASLAWMVERRAGWFHGSFLPRFDETSAWREALAREEERRGRQRDSARDRGG